MKLELGERVRNLRCERGLTQEKLADFLGVSFQAISKWERGDTVPDIYMLPSIASFFGVTIDYLLNYDLNREKDISEYEEKYYQLWHARDSDSLIILMKEAIARYPAEYRLLVRYLNALVWHTEKSNETAIEAKNEIIAVYERIRDNCTIESIRVWAKKITVGFYIKLSNMAGSGVSFRDAEEMIKELPLMQNCRDYMFCHFYKDEKRDMASKSAISELLYLLNDVITVNWVHRAAIPMKERIAALESLISVNNLFYTDGNFGKNYINMAFSLASLGCFYYKDGDIEKAKEKMQEAMTLAEKFDSLDEHLVHTAPLLEGFEIEKSKIPHENEGKMIDRIRKYIIQTQKIPLEVIE